MCRRILRHTTRRRFDRFHHIAATTHCLFLLHHPRNAVCQGHRQNRGRRKGTANKLTSTFRKAFPLAYEHFGGHEAFSRSAADNSTEFYRIAARLISTEIKSSDGEGLTVIVNRSGTVIDHPGAELMTSPSETQTLGATRFSPITKRTKYRTQKSKVCLVGTQLPHAWGCKARMI